MASPMAVAGALKGIGKIAGLFGKNKTKVKDIPLSATITKGLDENEKFLSADSARIRGLTDNAASSWQGLLPRMKERLDTDLLRMDSYRSGGPQENRRRAAIGEYGDALRAANQDAIDASSRRFSQQQALMGSGGGMSPFMRMQQANQLGAMNRDVAARLGALNLGNIDRYEGFERGDFGKGQALMNAYGSSMMQPVRALSQGNQAINNMFAQAIGNRRNSMDRLIQQKPNTMQKISNAFSGTGDAMQNQMLTNAYMNKLDPSGSANSWSNFNPFSSFARDKSADSIIPTS